MTKAFILYIDKGLFAPVDKIMNDNCINIVSVEFKCLESIAIVMN